MPKPVRTAGGVVWRPAGDGFEICVVHRPHLADWVLPKGHLDGSEHTLVAAVREVEEETGLRAVPQLRLPEVAYTLPNGKPKTVDFWLMRAADGPGTAPHDPTEVDEIAWLTPAAAIGRLTYPTDRALIEHVMTLPPVTAVTVLIRHANAGKRKEFAGDDSLRPVDERGRAQAETVTAAAATLAPQLLFSALPLRCRQTIAPLAERLGGLEVTLEEAFSEPADEDRTARAKAAADRILDLRDGPTAAICSQGKVIPGALALLAGEGSYKTPKGEGWVLSWSGDRLVGLTRI